MKELETLVYFDPSVWISFIIPDDHFYKAKALLQRLGPDKDQVIISTLVLLEVIGVIRKRVAQKEKYGGLFPEEKLSVMAKIDSKIRDFTDYVTKLQQQGLAYIANPDVDLESYLQDTMSAFKIRAGEIARSTLCPLCQRSLEIPAYRHRGLGFWDIQHGFNAHRCTASEICAFDGSFPDLNNIPELAALKVTVP